MYICNKTYIDIFKNFILYKLFVFVLIVFLERLIVIEFLYVDIWSYRENMKKEIVLVKWKFFWNDGIC